MGIFSSRKTTAQQQREFDTIGTTQDRNGRVRVNEKKYSKTTKPRPFPGSMSDPK